jgi:hypothetical protein
MNFILLPPARKGFSRLTGAAGAGGATHSQFDTCNDFAAARPPVAHSELRLSRELNLRPSVAPTRCSMPYQVLDYIDSVTRAAGHLSREQWVILSVLILAVGMFCMRGFGSRNNY